MAGTLILVLCEYPCFEYFDNEVFIGGEDVIVVSVTVMSLSMVEVHRITGQINPKIRKTSTVTDN